MERSTIITCRTLRIASFLLLVIGFGMVKIWLGVILVSVLAIYWWLSLYFKRESSSSVTLMIFVGIAAWGIISHVSSFIMIAGVSAALACWELEDHISLSTNSTTPFHTSPYQKYHSRILAIAITTGFFIAEAGLFLKISLPFGIVFLAALLVLFCLFQLFFLVKKNDKHL